MHCEIRYVIRALCYIVSLIVGFGRWPMQRCEAQGNEFQATASNQVCHQVSTQCKEWCCAKSMGEGGGREAVG